MSKSGKRDSRRRCPKGRGTARPRLKYDWMKWLFPVAGLVSLVWFLARVTHESGTDRIPVDQAVDTNAYRFTSEVSVSVNDPRLNHASVHWSLAPQTLGTTNHGCAPFRGTGQGIPIHHEDASRKQPKLFDQNTVSLAKCGIPMIREGRNALNACCAAPSFLRKRQIHAEGQNRHIGTQLSRLFIEPPGLHVAHRGVERRHRRNNADLASEG